MASGKLLSDSKKTENNRDDGCEPLLFLSCQVYHRKRSGMMRKSRGEGNGSPVYILPQRKTE